MIYNCPHCKGTYKLSPLTDVMLTTSPTYIETGKVEAIGSCTKDCNAFVLVIKREDSAGRITNYTIRPIKKDDYGKRFPIVTFVPTAPLNMEPHAEVIYRLP